VRRATTWRSESASSARTPVTTRSGARHPDAGAHLAGVGRLSARLAPSRLPPAEPGWPWQPERRRSNVHRHRRRQRVGTGAVRALHVRRRSPARAIAEYLELAESASVPSVGYLIVLILADDERHHRCASSAEDRLEQVTVRWEGFDGTGHLRIIRTSGDHATRMPAHRPGVEGPRSAGRRFVPRGPGPNPAPAPSKPGWV
jgi:hypothetical protein